MPKKTKVNKLYWFCHFIINIYMYTLCRLKVQGIENIPLSEGLIIASNHISGADPFLLGSTIPRELHFMAKQELFKPFPLKQIMPRLNAFPVDRYNFDLEVIKKAISFLKQGRALIMFPEGTRSKDSRLKEGKIGVGMLAKKTGVPIVPVYIKNTKKAWWNLFRGKRLGVTFGKIIESDWIKSRETSKEGYREITDKLMEKINELQTASENI